MNGTSEASETRLSNFRKLLSQVDHEYSMLLGEASLHLTEELASAVNDVPDEMTRLEVQFSSEVEVAPVGELDVVPSEFASHIKFQPSLDLGPRASATSAKSDGCVLSLPEDEADAGLHSTNHIHFRSSGTSYSSQDPGPSQPFLKKVFPIWWNPDKAELEQIGFWEAKTLTETRFTSTNTKRVQFVLSPVTFPKLHWDLLGCALILYDSWATPFLILFDYASNSLSWMRVMEYMITCFFALDILLNFNTGIVEDGVISFDRSDIMREYLQRWFWIDFVATVPYDLIYRGMSITSILRFLKFLKAARVLKLIRLVQKLRSLQTESNYFNMITKSKNVMLLLAFASLVLLSVHFFTCWWLFFLEPDSSNAEASEDPFYVYFDTYQMIFLAMVNGARLHATSNSLKLLEMLIAAVQLAIMCCFATCAIFEVLITYGDGAKSRLMRDQTLRYMRRHGLPAKTQMQVLSALTQTRSAKALQNDFTTLSNRDLPEELRRKVFFELWGDKLISLDLIAEIALWDDEEDFCRNLAQICREEQLSTGTALFSAHDLSIAAYHILSGELRVICPMILNEIPIFRQGMWVGENALVNPSFRRGLGACSLCLSSVMVVPAEEFQTLLQESNHWYRFEDFLRQEVWHGICGRCGSVGDHFFDDCPLRHVQWRASKASTFLLPSKKSKKQASAHSVVSVKELTAFLQLQDALHLMAYLNEMQVFSLSELENLDLDSLIAHLKSKVPPVLLSKEELALLSSNCVKVHRENIDKGIWADSSSSLFRLGGDRHLAFLSHFKVEAGTEAALMRSELERFFAQSADKDANQFDVPFFLDSEDLTDLSELRSHVRRSNHLVLLLTRSVLSRPWVLVELVTAVQFGIPVVPVQVDKPTVEFQYPDEVFYADLQAGRFLNESAMKLLIDCNIDMVTLEGTLRRVFETISLKYSPHRPGHVRQAELQDLFMRLKTRATQAKRTSAGRIQSITSRATDRDISRDDSSEMPALAQSPQELRKARLKTMMADHVAGKTSQDLNSARPSLTGSQSLTGTSFMA